MNSVINFEISQNKIVYDVLIGNNIFHKLKIFLNTLLVKKILVVSDKNVNKFYGNMIKEFFETMEFNYDFCILENGEKEKNFENLEIILNRAFENKLERKDVIIAFGGGVVGDITGFASSIYLRGINFIQIPTTLLAQIDSSIGGKTAINTKFGKNLIGAFYQPKFVLSDINFLNTLPLRELKTGLGEALKYAFIEKNCCENTPMLFDFLMQNKNEIFELKENALCSLVQKCVELKRNIVTKDEKENELRMVLNFGHTIGHAIEKTTNYEQFTHGEAITLGMKAVFSIALKLQKIDEEYFKKVIELLTLYDFDLKIPENVNVNDIFNALIYDKKVKNSKIQFVIPVETSKVEIATGIDEQIIKSSIEELY